MWGNGTVGIWHAVAGGTVVIVVAGAIIVAGAVRVGVQSLVVDSPQELISANDITTPSIILEMSS